MGEININDKWLIVYDGTITNYHGDLYKDSFTDKLVLVLGDKTSTVESHRTSYICAKVGNNSIEVPIPDVYLTGVKVGNLSMGFSTRIMEFAQSNGISISLSGGKVNIGINNDTLTKINSIEDKVDKETYNAKVSELESEIKDVGASIPETLPNPEALVISLNGRPLETYNGSSTYRLSFYAPTKAGPKGQVFKSIDGITVDWDNVDWSEIKNKPDVINFAKDLTGVLEATPEEFTYRPSAGNKSIRDEGAVIRRIKGNTTVWGQCCKNPYLELDKIYNKNQSNASYTNTDGGLRITYNSVGNPQGYYLFSTLLENLVKGHIYMVSIDARVSSGLNVEMELYPNYDTVLVFHPNEEWHRYAALYTLTRNTFNNYYYVGINKSSTTTVNAGDYFEFRNAQFIDLTNIFGDGNEPQTYEDFNAIYPDIYPYCEPEIRNVKTTAIETVGFNQFDKNSAVVGILTSTGSIENTSSFSKRYFTTRLNVLPDTTYYLLNVSNFYHTRSYVFYDTFGNVISSGGLQAPSSDYNASGTVTTPNDAAYMGVVVHDTFIDQCCINLSHTGVKNGEYEPYKKNTLLLPEITKYFFNGMNGIGDVYDEINSENAVTRIGVVDLGTLTWIKQNDTTDGINYRWRSDSLRGILASVSEITTIGNIICKNYSSVSASNTYDKVNGIATYDGRLYIYDESFDPNILSTNEFKTAMSGVYLYYELAEPEIRPILEPIQLVYDVEDFGTERAIAPENSAPFRADIVYQFNAEGRIRDNGRNIERLEKSTNILSYDVERLNGRFDGDFVVAKGIVDYNSNGFLLPEVVGNGRGYNLATEDYVINSIPTEVATATQIRAFEYTAEITPFIPNIMYECSRGLPGNETIPIPLLSEAPDGYDHVWMIRFPAITATDNFSYPFNIRWKDGTGPRYNTDCTLELYFKKIGGNVIIGEWKIYR